MRAAQISDQAAEHFASNPTKLFIPRAGNAINTGENNIVHRYSSMDDAFPQVDAGHRPLGNLVLVQIRQPKMRTAGGIIIDTELRKTEQNNTQIAKVVALGPLCFRNRNTYDLWPEGAWCELGSFVRIPKYQGDRFTVPFEIDDYDIEDGTGRRKDTKVQDTAEFCFLKDTALVAIVAEPLTVRAFL